MNGIYPSQKIDSKNMIYHTKYLNGNQASNWSLKICLILNPFCAIDLFWYPLKTSEHIRVFLMFSGGIKKISGMKWVKVGLSSSWKFVLFCFNKGPLKIMKNVLYFIFTAFFVLKILKFMQKKMAWLEK